MSYVGFGKLKSELSHEKGVYNPGGLAASIGRDKYTKKRFNLYASKGKTMRNAKVRRPKT